MKVNGKWLPGECVVNTTVLMRDRLCVTRFPIVVGLDCLTHLGFDVTHDERRKGVGERMGSKPPKQSAERSVVRSLAPLHSFNILDFGGLCGFSGHFSDWHNFTF